MKYKHEASDILDTLIDDRFRVMRRANIKIPLIKLMNLDLLAKFGFLCLNSTGKATKGRIIFVDEVKNGSMIINLHNTMECCPESYSVVDFRNRGTDGHIKIGFVLPVVLLILTFLESFFLYLLTPFLGLERINRMSSRLLMEHTFRFVDQWVCQGYTVVYVMTDHNFYSTIVCCHPGLESNVLQHGLILDASYYKVYAANHFLAWGKRSEELMNDPQHVRVAGTCKFSQIRVRADMIPKEKSVLFCVSSINYEEVRQKIFALKGLFAELGYLFAVKLHPGSGFRGEDLAAENKDVKFYKEELLQDIPFTVGIIENSTVLLDLMYLEKPFIIFSEDRGYFSVYPEVPLARSAEELKVVIPAAERTNYQKLRGNILEYELNGGSNSIFQI